MYDVVQSGQLTPPNTPKYKDVLDAIHSNINQINAKLLPVKIEPTQCKPATQEANCELLDDLHNVLTRLEALSNSIDL